MFTGGNGAVPEKKTMEQRKTIVIVIPFLNEEACLPPLVQRLTAVMEKEPVTLQILFVDDGSTDGSALWVARKAQEDARVRLLRLSRNFGHQIAITAGLDHAEGDAVIVIDADLQDPPEVIPRLLAKWREGFKVVYAVRQTRAGEFFFRKLLIKCFYRLFHRMANVAIPMDSGDFRLMDRSVVLALRSMRESHRYIRGMTSWIGFDQCAVEYDRDARHAGVTKYPFFKLLGLALDGLTSFSGAPLRWVSSLGFGVSVLGVFWLAMILWSKWMNPNAIIAGWTSVIAALLMFSGLQLICLGLLGQYLSRTFEESKRRPLYFIKQDLSLPSAARNSPQAS